MCSWCTQLVIGAKAPIDEEYSKIFYVWQLGFTKQGYSGLELGSLETKHNRISKSECNEGCKYFSAEKSIRSKKYA